MQHNLFNSNKIKIDRSNISGRGVFAKEDIKLGTLLEQCHFIIPEKDHGGQDANLRRYMFCFPEKDKSCSLKNDLLNKATPCSWVLGRRPRVTHRFLAPSPHAISGPWVRWLSLVNGSKCQRFQLPAEATGGHTVQDLGLPSQHLPQKLS